MPNFKKGDKVRVRSDSASPYRGRIGVVNEELPQDSFGFCYMVTFESKGLHAVARLGEQHLEKVND
jgi:hypothetical protein